MMAETRSLDQPARAERPLSPHLQIYRPMLTMMMSIAHRITGFGNYFGMLLLVWWLIAVASPNGYARFQWFASSWFGRLILFGYTWSVIHHMLGGIRHLIWTPAVVLARRSANGWQRPISSVRSRLPWCCGFSSCSRWESDNDRAHPYPHAARPRARPRRRQVGHRAFLAPAAHRGCQCAADHHRDVHHDRAARPQPGRRCSDPRLAGGRHHHAVVHRVSYHPHADRDGGDHRRLRP